MNEVKRDSPTGIRLPDDLKKKLKAQAKKEDRSLSNLIIMILRKYFK